MAKADVKIVLSTKRTIHGRALPAGYVILEGSAAEGLTGDDVSKAIQLGEVKIIAVTSKTDGKK